MLHTQVNGGGQQHPVLEVPTHSVVQQAASGDAYHTAGRHQQVPGGYATEVSERAYTGGKARWQQLTRGDSCRA